MRSDEVLESEKIDRGELLDGASCGQPGACRVNASGRSSRDLGRRVGVDTIHPHAFRQACGVELLERSGGNLRAVQEHLRNADIQTTI